MVADLGCGPGNSTELLAARFSDATVSGIDTSAAMLASARRRLPEVGFAQQDVATWRPAAPPALIFANAVLQWIPDHRVLLPRLFALLQPGGVLAVQMPDNRDEPSHRLMRELAATGPWRDALSRAAEARGGNVLAAADYYDLFARTAVVLDVWRTTYQHAMATSADIVDWVRATGLRPFLDSLTGARQADFLPAYEAAMADAYPVRPDGRRLFPFPRLFIVAKRASAPFL